MKTNLHVYLQGHLFDGGRMEHDAALKMAKQLADSFPLGYACFGWPTKDGARTVVLFGHIPGHGGKAPNAPLWQDDQSPFDGDKS